jgi:hypothetical protein
MKKKSPGNLRTYDVCHVLFFLSQNGKKAVLTMF